MKNLTLLIFAALTFMIAGCDQQKVEEATAATKGPPPANVMSSKVETRDVPVSYAYTGQVAASHEVEVRARVSGIIEKRLYEEGSYIEQGEPLFTIDRAPLNATMAEAQAALVTAKASKTSALAQLKKAKRDFARVTPLVKRNLLSQSTQDDAESALDIAQAAVQQTDAVIAQARAAVKTVQINLDYTKVTAPISGIAGRAMKLQGSLVQAGSDSLLTTLSQTNPAYVNFGIPESEQLQQQQELTAGSLRIPESGFKVELTSSNGQQLPQKGKVNFEDFKSDPQTGNFAVRATVDNPERRLAPGQFVRVNLIGAIRPNAIVVPQRAVLDNPQGKYVYVVAKTNGPDNQEMTIAEQRPVVVGEWVQLDGDLKNAWVIKSGLNIGDQVVTEGSARIFFPGMPIIATDSAELAKDQNKPSQDATKQTAPDSADQTIKKPVIKSNQDSTSSAKSGGVYKNTIKRNPKADAKTDYTTFLDTDLKSELEREMQNLVDTNAQNQAEQN